MGVSSKNIRGSVKKNGHISEKDYLHVANVWDEFQMKSLGNYHDLYIKTDVLLLTDVVEKFINTYLEYYGLDSYIVVPD